MGENGFKPTLLFFLCQRKECRKPLFRLTGDDDDGDSEWVCEAGHKNLVNLRYTFGDRIRVLDVSPALELVQQIATFPDACTCGAAIDRRKISAQVGVYQCGNCGKYWVVNTNTGELEEAMSSG